MVLLNVTNIKHLNFIELLMVFHPYLHHIFGSVPWSNKFGECWCTEQSAGSQI